MKKYLLSESGTFYKANLHGHTTVSDGKFSPMEVKERYKAHGYSIVAYTDHDVLVPHPELADDAFLPLHGYEMEISEEDARPFRFKKSCHRCLIATKPDNLRQVCYHRDRYLFGNAPLYRDKIQYDETAPDYERKYTHAGISEIMQIGRENGFFVTYNHPTWSLENYGEYSGYNHMHAMEICNFSSYVMGYPEYNEKEYDDMLRGGKRIFCVAGDDNHGERDSCGAFTMIKAEKLAYETVTDALLRGDFYASQAPFIYDLWFENGKIGITCSDAKRIVLNTANRRAAYVQAKEDEFVREAVFDVMPEDGYVRITVTDAEGNHANTNAYFTDMLFEAK